MNYCSSSRSRNLLKSYAKGALHLMTITDPELSALRSQYEQTDDFIERMDILAKIEEREVLLGLTIPRRPPDTDFECVGCGS